VLLGRSTIEVVELTESKAQIAAARDEIAGLIKRIKQAETRERISKAGRWRPRRSSPNSFSPPPDLDHGDLHAYFDLSFTHGK